MCPLFTKRLRTCVENGTSPKHHLNRNSTPSTRFQSSMWIEQRNCLLSIGQHQRRKQLSEKALSRKGKGRRPILCARPSVYAFVVDFTNLDVTKETRVKSVRRSQGMQGRFASRVTENTSKIQVLYVGAMDVSTKRKPNSSVTTGYTTVNYTKWRSSGTSLATVLYPMHSLCVSPFDRTARHAVHSM